MVFYICDRIKTLREQRGMTQTQIAQKLGITRSSVNAWEMGLSIPSTQYIIQLAMIFNVSTDYLLGMEKTATVNVNGLSEKEIAIVVDLIDCLNQKKIAQ